MLLFIIIECHIAWAFPNYRLKIKKPSSIERTRSIRCSDKEEVPNDTRGRIPEMFFATVAKSEKKKNRQSDESAVIDNHTSTNQFGREAQNAATHEGPPYSRELANIIFRPEIELFDTGLVLLSSFIVAVSTLPATTIPESLFNGCIFLEDNILSYFFGIAFFVRWYAVGQLRVNYLIKPLPFIDFIASVVPLVLTNVVTLLGITNFPVWMMSSSALVNLRLLRILRLQDLLVDLDTFASLGRVLGFKEGDVRPYQLQLARVLISIFTLCSVASGLIYTAEHEVNPLIPDYFTSLYFGLTTLTTVGFGDITPITLQGKLVVMGSILTGVAVIPAQAASLVDALFEFQEEKRKAKMIKNTLRTRLDGYETDSMIDPRIACPSCGRRSHRDDALYCWNCGSKLWQ
jgi:voltage-gated potassium channel